MTTLTRRLPAFAAAFMGIAIVAPASHADAKKPTKPTLPPIATKVKFTKDLKGSLAESQTTGKLVLVDVYTDWCYWCRKLDSGTYSEGGVADAVKKDFIAVKLNPEKDEGGRDFAKTYKVKGFPTILFLDGTGKEIHRIVGYDPPAYFLNELRTARKKYAAQAPPSPSTATGASKKTASSGCCAPAAPLKSKTAAAEHAVGKAGTAAALAKQTAAQCPVTGEKIARITAATAKSTFQGKTYYFCCPGCKPKFDKDPAKYARSAA
jgi:YHS domain-containing protein/thiol-disulfide isomerase/thioredoxin